MARHVPARELDLRQQHDTLDANTVAERMNALPGFKTSAAFFTFLRANLVLAPTTAMSSNTSTPVLKPSSSQTLSPPPLGQLPTSAPSDPLANLPPLTTEILKPLDRIAGLKLIADSVAQMRQTASRALIFSPVFVALWVLMIALDTHYLWKTRGDFGLAFCTAGGCTMAMLLACRWLTGGYLYEAEKLGFDFLKNGDQGDEDILLGTKYGDEVIGSLSLRLERAGSGGKKKGKLPKGGKGVIRGWSVRLRYRHKGIGTGLLEEAIRITREHLGRDAEVGFAADHANSKMILPEIFNGPFNRDQARAVKLLEEVERNADGRRKR